MGEAVAITSHTAVVAVASHAAIVAIMGEAVAITRHAAVVAIAARRKLRCAALTAFALALLHLLPWSSLGGSPVSILGYGK